MGLSNRALGIGARQVTGPALVLRRNSIMRARNGAIFFDSLLASLTALFLRQEGREQLTVDILGTLITELDLVESVLVLLSELKSAIDSVLVDLD